MEFTQYGNIYIAEQSISGDTFNLHVEAEDDSLIVVEVKTSGNEFAILDSKSAPVIDEIYTNGGIPATIRVTVSAESEPEAIITEA